MANILPIKWVALLGLSLAVTGCHAQSKQEDMTRSPETQTRVKALVAKTLKQMKLNKAGSFWLGDFGQFLKPDSANPDQPRQCNTTARP